MPRVRPVGITAILALALLASCSSAKHATQDTTSTSTAVATSTSAVESTTTVFLPPTQGTGPTPTTTSSGVRFESLGGPPPPVPCNAPSQVQLHWETQHATSVTLRINGGPVFARYSGGRRSELEPLACNGKPQRYELTAHAANGDTAVQTLTLAERKTT